MAAAQWHYLLPDNQRHGPVTRGQLQRLADDGTLTRHDYIWKEGMADWRQAGELRGLFQDERQQPRRAAADPNPYEIGRAAGVTQTAYDPKRSAPFGIAALTLGVVGLVAFCCPLLGLPFSVLGLVFAVVSRSSDEPPGFATAALVLTILGLIWHLGFLALYGVAVFDAVNNLPQGPPVAPVPNAPPAPVQ